MNPFEFRTCSNCFKAKALTDFYVKRPNGYQSRCKACNAEVVRGYKQRRQAKDLARRWSLIFNRAPKGLE